VNRGHPKYEARVLTTRPRSSVRARARARARVWVCARVRMSVRMSECVACTDFLNMQLKETVCEVDSTGNRVHYQTLMNTVTNLLGT
jgi:hypothetical protein